MMAPLILAEVRKILEQEFDNIARVRLDNESGTTAIQVDLLDDRHARADLLPEKLLKLEQAKYLADLLAHRLHRTV